MEFTESPNARSSGGGRTYSVVGMCSVPNLRVRDHYYGGSCVDLVLEPWGSSTSAEVLDLEVRSLMR
jgi:hypothetical protein